MLDGRATFLSLPIGKTLPKADFLGVTRSRQHASYPSNIVFMLSGLQNIAVRNSKAGTHACTVNFPDNY
jgi:hypothetical protein